MISLFHKYIRALQKFNINDVTEHTYRKDLQDLLENIANAKGINVQVQHEPKHKIGFGAPDFKIKSIEAIIGYVENKKLSENLDKTIKSEQISKYKQLSNNILLTNYIEWIWIKDGEVIDRVKLCNLSDIETKSNSVNTDNVTKLSALILNFYSQTPKGISQPKILAEVLALRARFLRDFLNLELERQSVEHREGRLYGLYDTFKVNVFTEITIKEFSDAFSQTLVYGLFLARLNAGTQIIDLYNAKKYILPAFGLISELVDFLDVLNDPSYNDAKWIVEEILSVMNTLNLKSIVKNLSYERFKTTNLFDEENISYKDPYIYFYQHFLAAYDKDLRKKKGVYYTPPQVVNFIVRSLEEILIDKFGIEAGFANKDKITVLDFATGTGTFLLEILEQIFDSLPKNSGKKKALIKDHILKNLYGFEYLIAPYTVANLKLSQYLKDEGYELEDDDRFQIYLTNTLELLSTQVKIPLLPALSKEVKLAQEVKDKPILIITGNPPYSKESKNNGEWIVKLVEDYKYIDGKHFGEKQNWFRDDYVKFIRFAQWKMDQVEEGIVGIITNHTFIDNITFPGMRQSLLNSFDQIYILDLHGSVKKEEIAPNGMENKNVFDIEQGVAISFFIKKPGLEKKIFHSEMWGSRKEKYQNCTDLSYRSTKWKEINPSSPYYFFYPRHEAFKELYNSYYSLKDIFKLYSLPLMTGNDSITIHYNVPELIQTIDHFFNEDEKTLKDRFGIKTEKSNWQISKAKNDVVKSKGELKNIIKVLYRPFDVRRTYYTGNSSGFLSRPGSITKHMIFDNIGLLVPRQLSKMSFQHIFCTNLIPEMCCISSSTKEQNQLFPLYLYVEEIGINGTRSFAKEPNFNKHFIQNIEAKYQSKITPEQIIGYIYSILHSKSYRIKYFEELKVEFPKIPFVDLEDTFFQLSSVGTALLDSHLLINKPLRRSNFIGDGNGIVEKIKYVSNSKNLYINSSQYFSDITEDVYEFKIGGYKPIEKFLTSRKGRNLSIDEIETTETIIDIVYFTIIKMNEIDALTSSWI